MKILFDTNIVLDVLLNRKPFVELSAHLMGLAEQRTIHGYICATTITTIDYLISKSHNRKVAKQQIGKIFSIFEISPVDRDVLQQALTMKMTDYEDAVQCQSGVASLVDGLVTRNTRDYKDAPFTIYTPEELCTILTQLRKK